jgi:hypothetical protein
MSSPATPDTVNLFKECYGELQDILPQDFMLQEDIPFSEAGKVGEKFVEAVVLTNETGWSILGSEAVALTINPAIAGAVQQCEITPYQTVLASLVPWGMISRTQGNKQAFYSVTKHTVRNNLRSHGKLLEIIRIYGQSDNLLGRVSYYTGQYRGQAFTNGAGTVNSLAFVGGVNAANKLILMQKGDFAAGIWVGTEGAIVNQIDSAGTVVNTGKLVSVEPIYGYIQVDFAPTAATAISGAGSYRICFQGQEEARDAPGIMKIMSTTGTLFGISTSRYSLWKGNAINLGGSVKLQMSNVQDAIAQAVARGGLDGDIDLYVNPRSWARLITTESGLRVYDESYKSSKAETGFQSIVFWSQTGRITVKAHRFVMEGTALGMHLPDWTRSGSAEISFTVPGSPQELIFPLHDQTAWAFRSFSDQYMFCHAPAKSFFLYGIDDEAA